MKTPERCRINNKKKDMKTLVIGASSNPERYSYKATMMLDEYSHEVLPLGLKAGKIQGYEIITGRPSFNDVHTVTLYIGEKHQPEYYDYIISLNPKRIIFNPGTENSEFIELAESRGIIAEIACTLVMLRTGQF